jgi:hypothetical protein
MEKTPNNFPNLLSKFTWPKSPYYPMVSFQLGPATLWPAPEDSTRPPQPPNCGKMAMAGMAGMAVGRIKLRKLI